MGNGYDYATIENFKMNSREFSTLVDCSCVFELCQTANRYDYLNVASKEKHLTVYSDSTNNYRGRNKDLFNRFINDGVCK